MNSALERLSERRRSGPPPLVPGGSHEHSIPIGIIATILVHALVFLGAPKSFRSLSAPPAAANEYQEELEFNLTPEEAPTDPLRFIETNPNKPDNVPEDPKFFAAQNQQAAQENPTDENSDLPTTIGKDVPSSSIVSGERAEPQEAVAPGAQQQSAQENSEVAKESRNEAVAPLPGFEKLVGENEEGIGTNVAENSQRPRAVDEKRDGGDEPAQEEMVVATDQSNPGRQGPRERPRVNQNARPAVLANQPHGVSQAGQIGVDAKFSEFGDYLQELVEIVQAQWNRVLAQTATYPVTGSKVVVRFTLNSQGVISRIEEVEETAGKQGTYACLSAIQDPQPYRPWTKEMVAILGEDEEITFYFYYW